MSHLTFETIARLVDEAPSPVEAAHLDGCAVCRVELEDMRADAATLAALPAIDPPAGAWDGVADRLAAEGLIRTGRARFRWAGAALRIAAALVLFALGSLAGAAWSSDRQPAPIAQRDAPEAPVTATAPPEEAPTSQPASLQAETSPAMTGPVRVLSPALRANPRLASFLDGREPASYDEAVQLYRETEGLYLDVLTRMAELSTSGEAGDPYARLAALQAITSITSTALGQAPADPVLNGYYVTALAQRDATLRQIAARATDSWF